MIVTGAGGPRNLTGSELKSAIKKFAESSRGIFDQAAESGVRIALENHGGGLLATPESLPLLMDAIPFEHVGIALAPYHLPQDGKLLADLITTLGKRMFLFYAWEHGEGSSKPLPAALQMKQLPGYGPLDFRPLLSALKAARFEGWTSIFMHPVPRGIPILPTAPEVTAAVNRSREYLEYCLAGN
jgi:sugar phosphate isomerase/epimerase